MEQLKPSKPSSFDPHHPPDTALIDDCVHCGFCLPACPTYVLWGEEMDSPRGRIYMMKKSTQGEDPRAQVERNIPRPLADTLFRKLLFATFPYAGRLRLLALPMLLYQRSGLQRLVRATGVLRFLPKRMAAMESLLPQVPANVFKHLPALVAATSAPR